MRSPIEEKIVTARIALLLKKPFFGNMATRLKLIEKPEIGTAATDGRHLWYAPEFIERLNPKQTEFLLAHEVLHVAFEHMLRRGDRDPQAWNVACDYAINQILVDEGIGETPTGNDAPLLDEQYRGLSSEQIFDQLSDYQKQLKTLDVHIDLDKGEIKVPNKDGGTTSVPIPKMTDAEKNALKDEIKNSLLQSAKAAQASGAGNVPKGLERLINDITSPKLDWRSMLRQTIRSQIKNNYTWMRPSRKMYSTNAVLPGLDVQNELDICVSIDTSGSISEKMLQDFLGEINGIAEEFDDYKIKIWCFDTEVHSPETFETWDGKEIVNYKPAGYGGTDIGVNWRWMQENDVKPQLLVCFTDGETWDQWGDSDYCETLWVIHTNDRVKPPFGQTVYYG
jgi:predicted metal-dependent peptidase